jgi:hypothetical protein
MTPEEQALLGMPASVRVDRVFRLIGAVLAIQGLIALVATFAARAAFPFPLEWMEGAIAEHAARLAQGRSLYGPPSADFIPYLYPPLAYLPLAAVHVAGGQLPAMRAVSILAALISLACIGRCAAREAGNRLAGLVAAGLFAAGFGYTGAFLDLVRVDSVFIALVLLGVERLGAGRERSGLFWLAASAFAKQHGLVLMLAACGALWLRDKKRAIPRILAPCLLVLLVAGGLDLASGGWFVRYVVALPRSHPLLVPLLPAFVLVDMLALLPVASVSAAIGLWARRRRPTALDAVLIAAVIVSALGRAHPGGHDNVRLPAFALLCACGLTPLSKAWLDSQARRSHRVWVLACLGLQFVLLWQAPAVHWPSPLAADRFETLVDALEDCAQGGPAVALDHAGLTPTPFLHTMALSDLRLGTDQVLAARATDAVLQRLSDGDGPAAVAVGASFPALEAVLDQHYRLCRTLRAPPMATGFTPPAPRIYARLASAHP